MNGVNFEPCTYSPLCPARDIATMSTPPGLRATIIVVSETASKDASTDKCIPALQEVFATEGGGKFEASDTAIVPDDIMQIQRVITERTDSDDAVNLIVTSGGTGFTTTDVTPEVCDVHRALQHFTQGVRHGLLTLNQAVSPLIHKHAPGLV